MKSILIHLTYITSACVVLYCLIWNEWFPAPTKVLLTAIGLAVMFEEMNKKFFRFK